ncbi:hypothetical protein GCM10009745_80370 [Kribbella yunnanensis]|uniref:Uncharacterized protein n=1 Tax=Kribbella yunnanensis TaxID=190194 RepID=A0ABP4V7V4_9ACTN
MRQEHSAISSCVDQPLGIGQLSRQKIIQARQRCFAIIRLRLPELDPQALIQFFCDLLTDLWKPLFSETPSQRRGNACSVVKQVGGAVATGKSSNQARDRQTHAD